MLNRLLYIVVLCSGLLAGCITDNDALLTEHTMSKRQAMEDIDEFATILNKAHPSLYAYIEQEEFKRLTDSVKNSITGNISQRQLFNLLWIIDNRIGCAHSSIYLPDATQEKLAEQPFFFPYPVTLVEDSLLVNVEGYEVPQGARILAINGVQIDSILRHLAVYSSTDGVRPAIQQNLAIKEFGYNYYMYYGPEKSFSIQYRESGRRELITKTVNAVTLNRLGQRINSEQYYRDATDVNYDFSLEEEAGYALLTLRTFEYDTYSKSRGFNNFCKNSFELLQMKRGIKSLIIDIRENEGGNYINCHQLFAYLSGKPFYEFERVSTRVKNLPEQRFLSAAYSDADGEDISAMVGEDFYRATNGRYYMADTANALLPPRQKRFTGKVFVLVNTEVSSAASYFASLVKNARRGLIIGEETRGGAYMHNGFRNIVYELPNSDIQFSFAIANVVHTLGNKQDYGRGVIPDYKKPSTIADFTNNEDTQLNFVLDSLLK